MTNDTKFAAAGLTSNGVSLLAADELAAVNGGLLTGCDVPVHPSTPAPQGGGAMGMKGNWATSRTNTRHSN